MEERKNELGFKQHAAIEAISYYMWPKYSNRIQFTELDIPSYEHTKQFSSTQRYPSNSHKIFGENE